MSPTSTLLHDIPTDWSANLAQGRNRSEMPGKWKNKLFTLNHLITGLTQHVVGEKDGPCFLQGSTAAGLRTAKTMERLFIIGIDVDNGLPSKVIDNIILDKGLFCIRYTTHSHGKNYTEVKNDDWVKYQRENEDATIAEYLSVKKRYLPEIANNAVIAGKEFSKEGVLLRVEHPPMDKNRLIFILAKPWSVHDFETQREAIEAWKNAYVSFAAWLGIAVDKSCTDPSRLFYSPRYEAGAKREAIVHQGKAIDIFALPKRASIRPDAASNPYLAAAEAMGAKQSTDGATLKYWAAKRADRLQIFDLIENKAPEYLRPEKDHDDIHHIECPFEEEHTSHGGSGTFVTNAGEGVSASGFVIRCLHNSCADRDRLDFLAEMISKEWFTREDLDSPEFLLDLEEEEPQEEEQDEDEEVELEDQYEIDIGEIQHQESDCVLPDILSVSDLKTADEYLRSLAKSGQSLVAVSAEIDNLVELLKETYGVRTNRKEISASYSKYLSAELRLRKNQQKEAERQEAERLKREAKARAKAESERAKAEAEREKAKAKEREAKLKKEEREKEAIKKQEERAKRRKTETEKSTRPVIYVDEKDHLESVETALDALCKKNDEHPKIFRNAGGISRIVQDEQGLPRAQRMHVEELRWELNRVVRCLTTAGESFKEEPTPDRIVRDILANPELPFDVLDGIVTAPVFGADGEINTEVGYNKSSRLYFDPPKNFSIPDVPKEPTKEDVDKAIDLILGNALVDFPFDGPMNGQAERAHALCMVLQPFARQLIEGATPIYLIVKPTPGTGASKLVNIYSLISTGEDAIAQTETRSEDEIRKRVTSVLLEASPTFYLDNINYRIDSSALASAVTSSFWTDRLLGESRTIKVPVRHTWIFAGNNPTMSNEIARRCVRIRLDAKVERPELRTNFKHKNLEDWVRTNRQDLVWACLTLIQNWVAQGRPEGQAIKGSFEGWSRTMGGILDCAGVEGLLANDLEMRNDSDEEGEAIKALLGAWWARHADGLVTIGGEIGNEGIFDLYMDGEIQVPIPPGSPSQQKIAFGKYIKHLKDRIFSIEDDDGNEISVKVTLSDTKTKNKNHWQLARVEQ